MTRMARLLGQARAYLAGGALDDNPADLQRLAIALYRLLAAGAPVTEAALARTLVTDEVEVAANLARFPDSFVERDARGAITGFLGLGLAPTAHRLEVGGRTLYTWCALDGLFLPQLIGTAAVLYSACAATAEPVTVELAPDRLVAVRPAAAVMSLVSPDLAEVRADIRAAFCRHVRFFRDAEAFERWRARETETVAVPVTQAHALGRERNAARYPDVAL